MTTTTALNQIPFSFKKMAKEELQKEIKRINPFLLLGPDDIYVNIIRDTTLLSETLTDSLLKKSIGEPSLLSDNLAGLYSHPTDVIRVNKVTELNIMDVKNSIDRLSQVLINTYRKQVDDFWKSEKIAIPQELQINPINNFLKSLMERSSLIERVHQLDMLYPNLKQTISSYFNKKLKKLYNKDINPHAVQVLVFHKKDANVHSFFVGLDLINFVLNYSWFYYASDITILQIKMSQDVQNLKLDELLQKSDILAIKSQHQTKLDFFWQKNFTNYQVLAKFSYLRALFEQQNSELKLSKKGFTLALRAMGFSQEKIETINELDPKEIPLDILKTSLNPNRAEVSSLIINNQAASDILKICDTETNDLVIYIPGYKPSFIQDTKEEFLINWILHQVQSPDKLSSIASHFPLSSRMVNNSKLDAFLYPDYSKQNDNIKEITAQADIFSFFTERQKARVAADLYATGISKDIQLASFLNYQTTESAFFTTITAAIEYIPYLLPNLHTTSNDLHELFPNPYTTASEFMKKSLKGWDIDPDKTFIQVSSYKAQPITYDPIVPPVLGAGMNKSIQSLTEAALSNYREDPFFYGYIETIIYQSLSGKAEYTEDDQILGILPQDIERIIKEANLDTLHKNKLNSFWNAHVDRIKHFVKHRFLQEALEAYQKKNLSKKSFKIISEVAFYSLALEEGELPDFINPHLRIKAINIAGYSSTDLFLFCDTSQQQVILYIARNTKAFFIFKSYEKCICFLEETAKKEPIWQKMLLSHFSLDVQDSVLQALKKGSYIDGSSLATAPHQRPADCSFENSFTKHPITTTLITKSLFEIIQKNIQERSYLDANVIIISNRELMLKNILNIAKSIEILLLVPSFGFPILNWISLSALATEISINFYVTNSGDTVKERHQAALDVGISSAEFIFIMAFLSLRSLKFSKNQNQITIQEKPRPLASGSGVFSFSKKNPVSEEMFFDTTQPMQVWQIAASDALVNDLDAKAWFLDEQFLLFTGKTNKADHLIISSHGGIFPKSGTVQIPGNTELVVLGPHGWVLSDPKTANIAKGNVLSYGIINENTAFPTQVALNPSLFSGVPHAYPQQVDAKILAGTNVPGHIRNYILAKYQKFGVGQESYLDIVEIVDRSRNTLPIINEIGLKPVDILTIRNRRGKFYPNLEDVFKSLKNNGVQYKKITLQFCRSKIFKINPPIYTAPIL